MLRVCEQSDSPLSAPVARVVDLWNEKYHRSALGFVHRACTTSTSNRVLRCSYSSSAMDSLLELFPRIRTRWIRTALDGRLNERFPVSLFLPEHYWTVGFLSSLWSTRCVCVNSLIPFGCSRCANNHDKVSVSVIWHSAKSLSTKFMTKSISHREKTFAENLVKNLCSSSHWKNLCYSQHSLLRFGYFFTRS